MKAPVPNQRVGRETKGNIFRPSTVARMRHKRIAADWWKVLQEDRNLTSGLPSADSLSPAPPGGTPEGLGGRAEGAQGGRPLVRELWFIAVMAAAALLLLAAVLGAVLHKVTTQESAPPVTHALTRFVGLQVLNKPPPYTRERPPLVGLPMQKRSPMAVYPASNPVLVRSRSARPAGLVCSRGTF